MYNANFNFSKTQNMCKFYLITSNSQLNQYYQYKQLGFCDGTAFCYLLHSCFYNVISFNRTPLKPIVNSS